MDSRFVAEWKIIVESGTRKHLLRMRDRLVRFAATASRQSHRLITSEAACRNDWTIVSIDVDEAFPPGLTYGELAKLTGEPRQSVAFT